MTKSSSPWWQGASIYQIYPRSFYDSNGDGIGDLQGITHKLPYVADLGVDGIWISPFFTSPMIDFGYDVADYRDVDPIFGSLKDFEHLVEVAHKLKLKVVIDQVYSHTSDQHDWFKKSREAIRNRYSDWYVWHDAQPDGSPPTNWQSAFTGPAWSWDSRRKQYYLHNFLPQQPDLNLYSIEVQEALFDIARFWLDIGVDGFRLDAINCGMYDQELKDNPPKPVTPGQLKRPYLMQQHLYNASQPGMPDFFKKYRKVLDQYGDIFTVAEVGGEDPVNVMKSYINGNDKLSTAYSFEFLGSQEINSKMIQGILSNWQDKDNDGWPSWAFSNHDAPRVISRWSREVPHDQLAKLYLLLLVALRGNIFLYQGEELGLRQSDVPFDKLQDPEAISNWPDNMGRDGARTPIPWESDLPNYGFSSQEPWLPVNLHSAYDCVSEQLANNDSVLRFAQQLFNYRKTSSILKTADINFISGTGDLIAFERNNAETQLICFINTRAEEIVLPSAYQEDSEILFSNTERPIINNKLSAFSGIIFKR